MAYNSISGYSTTRLTGLSSGLDTDSLIKAAMTASQSKLDKMYQNKTKLEWKRDAYTDVRTKVNDFSNKFMSVLSPDNIFSKSAYKQYKVSMSSDKYSSYFSVKGTSSAQSGSHTITKATMATAATLTGAKHRNHVAGLSGATTTNMKAGTVTSTRQLLVKEDNGEYRPLANSDLTDSRLKLTNVYYTDAAGQKVQAFGDRQSLSVNGKSVIAVDNVGELAEGFKKAGVSMSVDPDGALVLSGSATGISGTISITNTDTNTGGNSVEAFGKNGFLGLVDIKPESVITGTNMTLGALAEARDANQSLDKDGKQPVANDLNGGNLSFKINGVQFDFESTHTIQDVLDKVNNSSADVTMSYDEASGQFMLRSDATGDNSTLKTENVVGSFFGGAESLTGIAVDETTGYPTIDRSKDTLASAASKMGLSLSKDTISFKINGQEFTFKTNVTLDKMMSEINSNKDANVRMTYSQITDSFEITSLETGHAQKVTFETDDANATNLFGFASNSATARGTDAILEIDGETITRASNKFVIDGLEITLHDNFTADTGQGLAGGASEAGLGKARLTVTQDVDSVVDKMKAFVTAYNELVDSLYGMTTEEKDYDYDALTEDQRDNMEKEDIEKWEAEAKKGILRNDNTIRSFLSKMRSAIFEKIGGTGFNDITGNTKDSGLSAYDLGFNTSKYEAGKYGGRLTFDEDKFRAALERDPEAVANVMAQVSDASDSATEYKESGFITKLYDAMSNFSSTMRGKNIANVNDQITQANKAMQNQIQKMYEEQERLYKQYAALETLMTSYQNQSQWMAQQFASLTGTNS